MKEVQSPANASSKVDGISLFPGPFTENLPPLPSYVMGIGCAKLSAGDREKPSYSALPRDKIQRERDGPLISSRL